MKKFITLLSLSFLFLALPACKKDPVPEKTPQQKLVGKWQIESMVENDHYSGTDHTTTYTGTASDYLDFQNNGKVFASMMGSTDLLDYSFTTADRITIDGDVFDVKTFTQNQFVISMKDYYGGGDYDEITVNLKR